MARQAARSALALLISILALAGGLLSGATPAYAHAIVVRTEPADGAVLAGPPQQLRLWFSEPIALSFTSFELIDSAGKHMTVTAHVDAAGAALAVRAENTSAAEVILDLPALPPSVYRLSWTALSNADLHNTAGSIVFGIQRATAGAAATATEALPSPLEVALRWLNLGAIAVLLGALALAVLALPRAARVPSLALIAAEQVAHMCGRLLTLAEWAGTAALLAGLALLLAQAMAVGGSLTSGLVSAWEIMSGTSYGLAWLFRQAALMLLIASLTFYRQRIGKLGAPSLARFVVLALALAIAFAQAFQSHVASGGEFVLLGVASSAVHIVAAGVWSGGLLALLVAAAPALQAGRDSAPLGWALLREFGRLAAASLAALLISGLLLTGQQVASIDALLATLYGRALLLKIGLVAGVALLGLLNAARLHAAVAGALGRLLRRPASWLPLQRIKQARIVQLELIGAALVLVFAATLSSAQPARGPAFDPPVAETLAAATTHADDLVVTLALKPNRPGQNFVTLGVFDTRRPAPAPIDEVAVQFRLPGQAPRLRIPATSLGKGRYEATDDSIASAGDMAIMVRVRRAGLPDTVATIPWTVLPAAQQPRAVLISNQPLAPWADRAALVIALLVGGLLAARRVWRLSPRVPFINTIKSGATGRRLRPLRKD